RILKHGFDGLLSEKRALLQNLKVFQDLSDTELQMLANAFLKVDKPRNARICTQGADSEELFLIYSGECCLVHEQELPSRNEMMDEGGDAGNEEMLPSAAVLRKSNNEMARRRMANSRKKTVSIEVARLSPGEFCGDLSALSISPHQDTVNTMSTSVLLALHHSDLQKHVPEGVLQRMCTEARMREEWRQRKRQTSSEALIASIKESEWVKEDSQGESDFRAAFEPIGPPERDASPSGPKRVATPQDAAGRPQSAGLRTRRSRIISDGAAHERSVGNLSSRARAQDAGTVAVTTTRDMVAAQHKKKLEKMEADKKATLELAPGVSDTNTTMEGHFHPRDGDDTGTPRMVAKLRAATNYALQTEAQPGEGSLPSTPPARRATGGDGEGASHMYRDHSVSRPSSQLAPCTEVDPGSTRKRQVAQKEPSSPFLALSSALAAGQEDTSLSPCRQNGMIRTSQDRLDN
ncbi:hypothetical protein CYMTET_17492, partial [Cymbomonas tetramitiformis]